MLIALTNAPASLDPKRHPKRLLKEMNILISRLKHNFPLYYEDLSFQKELPTIVEAFKLILNRIVFSLLV